MSKLESQHTHNQPIASRLRSSNHFYQSQGDHLSADTVITYTIKSPISSISTQEDQEIDSPDTALDNKLTTSTPNTTSDSSLQKLPREVQDYQIAQSYSEFQKISKTLPTTKYRYCSINPNSIPKLAAISKLLTPRVHSTQYKSYLSPQLSTRTFLELYNLNRI